MVAVGYVAFILHYAVNVPLADQWFDIYIVNDALTGHLSLHVLWMQYFQSRVLFPNLVVVVVGELQHYSVRTIVFVSALAYVASFFLLLALVRRYLARQLTIVPTLILALVWFSLAAVSDALWAFELGYYFSMLGLLAMLYFLMSAPAPGTLRVTVAAGAAVFASYSFAQGLLAWPVGLIVLLWAWPLSKQALLTVVLWIGAAVLTAAIFLWNFDLSATKGWCSHCTLNYDLGHPATFAGYLIRMIGNVVPSLNGSTGIVQVVAGLILLGASLVVLVVSLRERRWTRRPPLSLALVVFALLWDVIIAEGRLGLGSPGFHEYTLPQVVLLSGLTVFAWGHLPSAWSLSPTAHRRERVATVACILVAVAVVWQVLGSWNYGLSEARAFASSAQTGARLVVNLSTIPPDQRYCYEDVVFDDGFVPVSELAGMQAVISLARSNQLAMFAPGVRQAFAREGPLHLRVCVYAAAHHGQVPNRL